MVYLKIKKACLSNKRVYNEYFSKVGYYFNLKSPYYSKFTFIIFLNSVPALAKLNFSGVIKVKQLLDCFGKHKFFVGERWALQIVRILLLIVIILSAFPFALPLGKLNIKGRLT